MTIRVETAAGLFHPDAGLMGWQRGECYEFSDNPRYRGWLDGQIERGACTIVDATPTPVALEVGTPVRYLNKRGEYVETFIKRINADGTFGLPGVPHISGSKLEAA